MPLCLRGNKFPSMKAKMNFRTLKSKTSICMFLTYFSTRTVFSAVTVWQGRSAAQIALRFVVAPGLGPVGLRPRPLHTRTPRKSAPDLHVPAWIPVLRPE